MIFPFLEHPDKMVQVFENPVFNPDRHTVMTYPGHKRAKQKRKNQLRHKRHVKAKNHG
jgi:hypothetical protein